MAIKTLQIAVPDGAVKDTQVAADAAIAQSKVSGLVTALSNLSAALAGLPVYRGPWTASTAYRAGQLVTNPGGQLVAAKTDFTSSASYAAANWTDADVDSFRGSWAATTDYAIGDTLTYNRVLYQVTTAFTSGASFDATNLQTLGGGLAPPIAQGGNLGASSTLAMQPTDVARWLVGTLTANHALTITGLAAGQTVRLLLTQDATGGRTLTVNGTAVPVVSTVGASFIVEGFYDGTDLYVRGAV